MNDSEVKKLYSALLKKGYTPEDIGSEDVFTSKMSDEKNRKDLYNYVQGKGNFRLGSYENYERRLTALPANDNAATTSQPTGQAAVAVPSSAAVPSPSVDDVKVEPVTAAMPTSEGDRQEYAVGFGAGVKEGGKALWGGIKSAAGETSKLAIGSKDDYARAVERIYEMNDVGYDMSDFNAERAVRDHKMRQYEHDMEEYKKEIAKRKAERKGMGFFESIGHKMSDPQRPRDPFDRSASSTAKMYSPEGMTSEIELQRSYKLVEEALRENGGDIDEAKKWLIKQAKTDTWGDKTSEDAQQMLSEVKPTKGTAAWVGNMIPQMTGNMLAIGASLSPWTRWMSRPLGMANMAALTASSAGSSMAEARMYGEETGTDVSTGDVWAAGGTSALIEAGTEAIPFNRMFGGVQHATKKALGKAIGDVLTNNSAARTELVQLVERAQKELGKDLFSGKNAKEWIVDMGYEGMSEFLAEGGGALVPMIYANEEDYPTLSEVLKSGWEGAKGGIFMGAFLGGANRAVGHYHNRNRRKEQGYVDLAETKDGKVVEVLGKETKEFDDGTEEMTYSVMMPDGSLEHVSPTDIVDSKRISFEEFEHGVTAKMEADVADAYEEGRALMDEESDEGLIDARNGYELAKENLARNVGCEVEELEDALLGGGVYGSLEERLRNFNPENWGEEHTGLFVDYMNARARYNGMIERVQDDIDGKVATALQHIDENRGADGNITPAVLVDEEQDVYVVNRSGENVVVRDGNGQLRMVSADQVRLTGEPMSAETAKAEAEERIREEESAAAAARIDGTVQLVPGNVYPIATEEGESTVTIVQDNGDGSATVMLGGDEKQQLSLSVDAIQGMVDDHHRMRLEAMAEQAAIDAAARLQASQVDATASQPTKQTASDDALVGGTVPTTEQQTMANGQQTVSNTQGAVQEAAPATALERIPVNEQGEQDFEKAPVADSWAALLELNEGDAVEAKDTAEQMVQEAQKALEKEQKKKAAGGSTIMEIQKAKAAHKAMLRGLQSRVEYWTRVANYEEDMRKAEAEANRMSADEWATYNEMLAEHIKDVFDSVTDEEIISIFANEYEERDYYDERSRIDDALEQGVSEGQGSVEGDGGGRRMVQEDGRADGGDIEGRGEPSPHGVDDGGQQGASELSSPSVSGEQRGIAGLDGYTESDVEDLVREHVEDIISVEGFEDVRIVGIKVIGSRVNGNATEESDLDVLVEYEGNAREDSLFNLFNGGDVHAQLYIEGIQVDINPITRGKSGTIEQWMERNAGYDKEAATASQPTEIGENYWGKIFQWAKGRAIEAANFLKKAKSGYLKGVFYRKEIGNIDLFWGDKNGGLAHIIDKHVINYDDFSSVEEAISSIETVITQGEISQQKDGRIILSKEGNRVVIERTLEGNWILTAYDNSRKLKEKKRSEKDATRLHQDIFGKENGELVSPNSASESKGNDISGNNNGLGEKVASAEGEVNINPTEEEVAGLRKQLEEKAAENTKSKGKGVSLSENEDGNEDGRERFEAEGSEEVQRQSRGISSQTAPRGRDGVSEDKPLPEGSSGRVDTLGPGGNGEKRGGGIRPSEILAKQPKQPLSPEIQRAVDSYRARTSWDSAYDTLEVEFINYLRSESDYAIRNLYDDCIEHINAGEDVDEWRHISELIAQYVYSNERPYIVQQLSGRNLGERVPLTKIRELFESYNSDAGTRDLFARVYPLVEGFNLRIEFIKRDNRKDWLGSYAASKDRIRYNAGMLYSNVESDQSKADTILHEMIHSVVDYAMKEYGMLRQGVIKESRLSQELLDAAKELYDIYMEVRDHEALDGAYGVNKDASNVLGVEFVAELSNAEFRARLKRVDKSLWQRILDAFKKFFGLDVKESTHDRAIRALESLLDNYDGDARRAYHLREKAYFAGKKYSAGEEVERRRDVETSSQLRIQFEEERIDQEYLDAVHNGDWEKATDLFREYVLSKAENEGIVPMDYGVGYRGGAHSSIAKRIKEGNPDAITEAAYQMSIRIPRGSILVPMPSHNGDATYTVKLAETIAMATDSEVMDVLKGKARMSVYEAKQKGIQLSSDELGMYVTEELPKGRNVVIIDNVIDKGTTALAAVSAVKGASVVAYAYTLGDKSRVAPLKLAEPVTYDDNMRIIPLSERYNREYEDIRYREKRALKTVSVQDEHLQTVVSSADGAKVLKDLDIAITEYENNTQTKEKTFLGALAKVLGAKKHGSNSQYATFETVNGNVVTIRLSNHNAKASTFDLHDEAEGISIVVTAQENKGITNDGEAHVVEFFYDAIKLRKAEGKPLVEILKSIKQALYSGEYQDTTGLAERQEVNERLRSGNGAISDHDVSFQNDPISKFLGKSRHSKKQQAAFAERERRRMKQAVKEVAKKLGVTVDIVEDAALLQGRKAHAKGWFDVNNGKIVVVIPNHVSAWDAVQTVLHEGIAHHGLRKMFGKHFDTFIENVYANADAEVREKIHDLARLNGLDLAKATEEYLASLAEDTNFERAQHTGWWDKIKQFFVEMLTKAGIKLDIKLTDNELRYILWRSYKNLVDPSSVRTFAGVAEDVVMQSRLSVGNYTAATPSQHRGQLAADAALVGGVAPTAEQQATDNGRQTTAATPSQHRGQLADDAALVGGVAPTAEQQATDNGRFNEQLEGLNEENGRSVILSLGYPSDALLASGVENMPIRLYGSKLLSKAKKHGYKTTDIKGLPMALQHPIAVFEGSTAGSHAILTALSINGKNVLVSLSVGKGGHDVDFNIISSIYGKNEDSVVRWINDGKMRFVDKGKALDYLSVSAPIAEAQDNQELSSAANLVKTFENPTAREDILFRRGGGPMGDGTREEYDRRVRTSKLLKDGRKSKFALTRYNAMEAFVNELYSLEIAQDIIEKKYGIKLGSTYDAVKAENALSSTNLREYERFRKGMYEDMVSITDGWMQSGEEDGDSVRRYLICKSGLERNREFTVRDAINERIDGEKLPMLGMVTSWSEREALERKFAEKRDALRQAYAQERDALRQRLKDGDIGYAEFNRLSDEVALRHSGKEKIMDYSGLTSVTGDSENFRDMAESLVLDFEARHGDAPQLWNAMNRCTKAALQKSYDSGLMSKREFDHISQMFEWYIPMRGFSERTAEDVYSYINEDTGAFSATVKAAKGHLTESDDPLALIGNMMQSAILQGNRNKMKLKFLNMVQTYPSDLFVVDKVWLVEQADGSWKSEYPEIREDMSADEVAASLGAFEEKMDGLRTAKKARRYRGGLDVDFIIEEPIHKMQHAVSVMRSGERVMVYVNGNPRVAQALNGELKDKNQSIALELWDKYLRWYSASRTSYDVNFVLANLTRDTEHATMMTLMSEGAGESGRFMLNIVPSFLATLRGIRNEVKPTVAARRKKKDEKSERYDRYFGEFLRYGGETGYSHLLSVDDWKSMNDRRMTRLRGLAKGRAHAGRVLEYISDAFDYLNRIAEDTTRFNVYSRCRERGMDIGSSILAAKEITTNFNRKGSGRTPGLWGVLANIVRRWIPFANPIIQGMYRFFRVGAEHKAAFAAVCASHVALGIAIPLLNEFLHAVAGGDDDDEYMNQNDYTRRNNLMLFLGGGYLKVPLAPMFRELYGLGDIFYCSMRGYLSASDAALESVGQIRSMLSIEGQSGDEFSLIRLLTPDQFDWLNDIEQNVTFTGAPIYKDTPYQEWTPEHEKVYKDVWSPLVDVSRLVNRAMGGSDDVAAERSSKWINPAVWQYALSEIGGGPLKFVGDLTGMATDLVKGDFVENFSWYNVPVAKRFWTSPDDRTLDASLNRRYYDVMENEHDRSEHLLRTYKRKATDSVAGYAEKLDTFMKSPTYKRYEKIHGTKSTVNKLRDELKESGSNSVPMLEDTIRKLKIEMLDELEAMEK